MEKAEEKLEFPPQRAYFVASLVFVNNEGEILLTREKNNFETWTVPGGEVDYALKEQFFDTAARESREEVGIQSNRREMELLDVRISYPEGDNPYKKYGIIILIATYISKFRENQKIVLKQSEDPLERKYDVKDLIWMKPNDIRKKHLKVHKNFIKTIPKINFWIKHNDHRENK